MKPCTRCNEIKPYSDFPKRAKSADGLNPWCRECLNKQQREGYQKRTRGEARLSVDKIRNRENPCGCNNYQWCMPCRNFEKRRADKAGEIPVFRLKMIGSIRS